ncbi:hypothetical protein QQ045_016410 [Rhodiola kirilowii]
MALPSILTRKSLGGLAAGPSAVLSLGLAAQSHGVPTVASPDLSYDYGALEPVINGEIMQIHHQAYVTNYNKALEQLESEAEDEVGKDGFICRCPAFNSVL